MLESKELLWPPMVNSISDFQKSFFFPFFHRILCISLQVTRPES